MRVESLLYFKGWFLAGAQNGSDQLEYSRYAARPGKIERNIGTNISRNIFA
jgi:hypothetical protein